MLRVIGAGLPRTGTQSLKQALETLLDQPCYHMFEVFQHLSHVSAWAEAASGRPPVWEELLGGYVATVDYPAAAYWRELMEAYPDALVLLSLRDADSWWTSWRNTVLIRVPELPSPVRDMIYATWEARLGSGLDNETAARRAFETSNQRVRDAVPSGRLLEWHLGDGWDRICEALELAVPSDPFPHLNTTEAFLEQRIGPTQG